MRLMFACFLCLGLGFIVGWFSRGTTVTAPEMSAVTPSITPSLTIPAQTLRRSDGQVTDEAGQDEFATAMMEVRTLLDNERYAEAYDLLLIANGLAVEFSHEQTFIQVLAQLVDAYTREFIALRQTQRIDEFYEQLTFDYPQYAEYQFRLGKIRVQMGNNQEALLPLAQVSNHAQFGAEARALIAQIEDTEADLAFVELPLAGQDGQFIVQAEIDGGVQVNLLVDTGAAITAIDRGVLQQAGYDMNVEQQYFATANGVVAAPVLTIGELRLGDARVDNLSVGALSLDMGGGVVGLLGMNFLRHYDFRIDQNRRVLILDQR